MSKTAKPLDRKSAATLLQSLCSQPKRGAQESSPIRAIAFPSDWTMRKVAIPGHARAFTVPCYVVRIDIDEPGMAGTHGWQVRYREGTYGTRLISDAKFDSQTRKGTPSDSLHAAKVYLAAIWSGWPLRRLQSERPNKRHITGMTGVRVVWNEHRGRAQCHVRVDDLAGQPLASLYVGTASTYTKKKLDSRVAEGRQRRRNYLASLGQLDRLPTTA